MVHFDWYPKFPIWIKHGKYGAKGVQEQINGIVSYILKCLTIDTAKHYRMIL